MIRTFSHIFAISLVWCSVAPAADDVRQIWAAPAPFLDRIRSQITAPEADLGHNRPLADDLQNLAYAINQEIMAAESANWATPSPARKAIIEKWGNAMKPYTADLVKLALDKDTRDTGAGRQSRSLLDFAPPSAEFAEQVRKYVRVSDPPATGVAVGLLYEHRLLSQADKDVLKKMMSLAQTDEDRVQHAQGLLVYGISDWNDYLIEQARSVLKGRPPSNTPEDIFRYYRPALITANGLGSVASSLLPELEILMEDPDIKASGYSAHFKRACDIIKGKEDGSLGRGVAKNGSGPLGPWPTDVGQKQSNTNLPSAVQRPAPKVAPGEMPAPSPSVGPTSSTLWRTIVVVLTVAGLGLLRLIFKRRS